MAKSDKAKIIREYMPEYPDPIEVVAGERVSVGNEDAEFPGWVWCRSSDGREGWVPAELLSSEGSDAIILENYSARELAVQLGEEVIVEAVRHEWLLVRSTRKERGWIPASHAENVRGGPVEE
jgi:uncharacterized protein YgiM (DUF1202 family)